MTETSGKDLLASLQSTTVAENRSHDDVINSGLKSVFRDCSATFAIVFDARLSGCAISTTLLKGFEVTDTEHIGTIDGLILQDAPVAFDIGVDRGMWHGSEIYAGVSPAYSDYRILSTFLKLPQSSLILSVTGDLTIAGVRDLFKIARTLGGTCYYVSETQADYTLLKNVSDAEALIRRMLMEQCVRATGVNETDLRALIAGIE